MTVKYTHKTCYGRLARIIATDIVVNIRLQ